MLLQLDDPSSCTTFNSPVCLSQNCMCLMAGKCMWVWNQWWLFLARFTCPGTGVSKTNAGHRSAALVKGKNLANIQRFRVSSVLRLSSWCPVCGFLCGPREPPAALACSWNCTIFLWVNRNHDFGLQNYCTRLVSAAVPLGRLGGDHYLACLN